MILEMDQLNVFSSNSEQLIFHFFQSLELTGEDSVSPDYHHKIAAALGAVYVFYLIDKVLTNINIAKKEYKSNVSTLKPV